MNDQGSTVPPSMHESFHDKSRNPTFPPTSYVQGNYMRTTDLPSNVINYKFSESGSSPFAFRKRWGQIDWKKLGNLLLLC